MRDSLSSNKVLHSARRISRRELIKAAGVVVAGGALWPLSNHSVISALTMQTLSAALVRSTFLRRIGETFQVQLESAGALAVRLVEVRDLRSGDVRGTKAQTSTYKENSFSILFHGPSNRRLEQGTYHFKHRQISRFPLFIVPMAQEADIQYYEAIFNHQQA